MTSDRPRRSALFLPASNARALEKARTLASDTVIIDLEDAVGPEGKATAREAAVAALASGGYGPRELVVRANSLDAPGGAEDLAALKAAKAPIVLVPKVARPEDFAAYAAALAPETRIWAMIETCQAVLSIDAMGRASGTNRVDAWIVGPNDLAKEMRCRPGPMREPLVPLLVQIVAAARAHGLSVLDGGFNDFRDEAGLAAQCRQGADFGFDGKTLIHPGQIAAANHAFSPSADEVAWARTVAAAFDLPENRGKGVVSVEGKMVELLHLTEARRLLGVAAAIAAREAAAG
jgi:citrate lyase subunit beta/citryl-CoA lyase